MTKLIHIIFALMVLTLASKTSAALINYNGYTLDEETNIVTDGTLEWLQWDVTRGMSIDTAIADIADGFIDGVEYGLGWTLASNIQMAGVFNVFGFGADFIWDSDEQTEQWSLDPATNNDGVIEDIASDPELQFTALFGETENLSEIDNPNPYSMSRAIFGNDLDGDSLYNRAEVLDDYSTEHGVGTGAIWLRVDATESNFAWGAAGVALVREHGSTLPPTSANEPSVMVLLVFGLMGVIGIRRYNTNSNY